MFRDRFYCFSFSMLSFLIVPFVRCCLIHNWSFKMFLSRGVVDNCSVYMCGASVLFVSVSPSSTYHVRCCYSFSFSISCSQFTCFRFICSFFKLLIVPKLTFHTVSYMPFRISPFRRLSFRTSFASYIQRFSASCVQVFRPYFYRWILYVPKAFVFQLSCFIISVISISIS